MRRAWLGEPPEVSLPDPDENPAWYGEFALVYPPSTAPTPMNWPYTFRAMCDLRVISKQLPDTVSIFLGTIISYL